MHTFKYSPEIVSFFHMPEEKISSYMRQRNNWQARQDFVGRFGWSVLDDESIEIISDLNVHIQSVGAGRGYWEFCMQRVGINVVASDICPGNGQSDYPAKMWTTIHKRNMIDVVSQNCSSFALMFNWATYGENLVYDTVKKYLDNGGRTVIWIGESRMGCNGTDSVFDLFDNMKLKSRWIPNWDMIHDSLQIYEA